MRTKHETVLCVEEPEFPQVVVADLGGPDADNTPHGKTCAADVGCLQHSLGAQAEDGLHTVGAEDPDGSGAALHRYEICVLGGRESNDRSLSNPYQRNQRCNAVGEEEEADEIHECLFERPELLDSVP